MPCSYKSITQALIYSQDQYGHNQTLIPINTTHFKPTPPTPQPQTFESLLEDEISYDSFI